MRQVETISLPGRRCERTAAVLELQRRAIAAGFKIATVTPTVVIGTQGKYGAAFPVDSFLEQLAEELAARRPATIEDVGDELARLAIEGSGL